MSSHVEIVWTLGRLICVMVLQYYCNWESVNRAAPRRSRTLHVPTSSSQYSAPSPRLPLYIRQLWLMSRCRWPNYLYRVSWNASQTHSATPPFPTPYSRRFDVNSPSRFIRTWRWYVPSTINHSVLSVRCDLAAIISQKLSSPNEQKQPV